MSAHQDEGAERPSGLSRRPKVAGGRRHSHRVSVTAEEQSVLVTAAAARGVTVPRFLVELATEPTRVERLDVLRGIDERRGMLFRELLSTQRALGHIGTNLNQLAKAANAAGELPTEAQLEAIVDRLRESVQRIDRAVQGLRR